MQSRMNKMHKKERNKNHCGSGGLRAAFLRTTPYLCFRKYHCLYLLPPAATGMTDWKHRWFTRGPQGRKYSLGAYVSFCVCTSEGYNSWGISTAFILSVFILFPIGINYELVAHRLCVEIYI